MHGTDFNVNFSFGKSQKNLNSFYINSHQSKKSIKKLTSNGINFKYPTLR